MTGKKKKPMSQKEYRDFEGMRCPFCRERMVEWISGANLEGKEATAAMRCASCGKTWLEIYDLRGYEKTETDGA